MTPATPETSEQLKARGAFYTPAELTEFLSSWAIRTSSDRVLEPSCGDGAFITAIADRFAMLGLRELGPRLLGIEREPSEAAKARGMAPTADIRTIDFFDLDPARVEAVDVAIGNPPYVRYHAFNGTDRQRGLERALAQGVSLTQLASSWAHFVVHACGFLKPSGRLALVLPAELLHTDYGSPVREYLTRRFSSVVVVAFDQLVFRDAQVDAVLLLASHDDEHGLRIIRASSEADLAELKLVATANDAPTVTDGRWSAAVDRRAGQVYAEAVDTLAPLRLGEYASVDIGFVSGANDFFVLSREQVDALGLPQALLLPTVGRPSDMPGLAVRAEGLRWLLALNADSAEHPAVREYLAHGEELGVATRYKPRSRKRWYAVPLPTKPAHAFIPYMAHHGPRLIVNGLGARSTNLLHGVSLRPHAPSPAALAVAMASSLTLLSAEIEGRAYGGGVLKLETKEAERLQLPRLEPGYVARIAAAYDEADSLVRDGRIRDAARLADKLLGVDHDLLWQAYSTFRDRRLVRANSRQRVRSVISRRSCGEAAASP